MKPTAEHHERLVNINFASAYSYDLVKVEKKGHRKEELQQVIAWLTGFDESNLKQNSWKNTSPLNPSYNAMRSILMRNSSRDSSALNV